jgi:hypothetical protein
MVWEGGGGWWGCKNKIGKSPPIGNAERSHPYGDSLEGIQFLKIRISQYLKKSKDFAGGKTVGRKRSLYKISKLSHFIKNICPKILITGIQKKRLSNLSILSL